jgi:hypothetical protein
MLTWGLGTLTSAIVLALKIREPLPYQDTSRPRIPLLGGSQILQTKPPNRGFVIRMTSPATT